MKYVGLAIIMIMVCSLISSVGLMNVQEPEINISDVKAGSMLETKEIVQLEESASLKKDQPISNTNDLPGQGGYFMGETINTTASFPPLYINPFGVDTSIGPRPAGWTTSVHAIRQETKSNDSDYGIILAEHGDGVAEDSVHRLYITIMMQTNKPGTIYYGYYQNVSCVTGSGQSDFAYGSYTIGSEHIDSSGITEFYFRLNHLWDTLNYYQFAVYDYSSSSYDYIEVGSYFTVPTEDVHEIALYLDYFKFQSSELGSHLQSQYRYVTTQSKEHSFSFSNWVASDEVTLHIPTTWTLESLNPSATYTRSNNDYVLSDLLPTVYTVKFSESTNTSICLEDVSTTYLDDVNLDTGQDWQQNTSQNFDSVGLNSTLLVYGAKSLKLSDADNNTDCLNITNAVATGTAFISFKYYIQNIEGNFTFMYYNQSWQQFYLSNTTNRWQLFQDFINLTDDSFSNIAFQLEGNGVIFLDGFRIYNTTITAYTSAYQKTKIEGYLRNWDSLQDPIFDYEDITIYLKNNTSTLETWSKTTDSQGYFSAYSNYSFTASAYHIEVVTATTSLTQNSSTTYLIPDYDFPGNFPETVLWTKMDEGSGTNVSDSSGNGNHGTNQGASWTTTAINGSALDFESSESDYINFSDSDDFSFTDGAGNDLPFSIECWIKLESSGSAQYILAKWHHSGDHREYRLWIGSDNKVNLRLFNYDAAEYISIQSSVSLTIGSWYYLCATYDGSESSSGAFNLYFNGTVDSSAASSSSGSYVGMSNRDADLEFGRTLTTGYLDAIFDDVRIHKNLALSASQIAARFTNYSYYDPTRGEYYTYSSGSTSKSVQQKSYFTPLSISSTATITYSEFATYFTIDSDNETLISRVWLDEVMSGNYVIDHPIFKNGSIGTHNFSFITFMGDEQYVYLPTAITTYVYQVSLEFAVAALLFSYDVSFGLISTTYYSTWGNTTHRVADNGTWLADAQVEGSFTWSFTTTVGYHNITMYIYNGAVELDVIEFSFTILAPLVYWQVFFTFVDQNNLPLYYEFGKVYVNGSQQLSQYLTVLNGSLLHINITDNFNQNLYNQSHNITSDLTISVNVTAHQIIFLNAGDYPSEVVVYKDDIDGYNFTIPSRGGQPLFFLAGNYDYQVYYRAIQSVQSGVTIVESAKTKYGDLRQFSVGDDYALYVDASSPSRPVDATATVTPLSGAVFQFVSFIILITLGVLILIVFLRTRKPKIIEREVVKSEKTK